MKTYDIEYSDTAFDEQSETGSSAPEPNTSKNPNLAKFLRGFGALIVIAGMCSYLMEGWETWNGASRYFVMVAGSALLALAGLAMSFGLRENKGARVFLGLALISVLANITTLGGFVYSAFGFAGNVTIDFAALGMDWSVPEGALLGGMLATALLVLLPISLFAFKILNRPHANGLLATFALSAGLLLVPVRESLAIGALILVAVVLPLIFLHRNARNDAQFKTNEGKFAALSLFAPAIIMLARLFWLYEADTLIAWILCAIGFGALRYLTETVLVSKTAHYLNDCVSGFIAIVIAWTTCVLVEPILAEEFVVPLGVMLFSGLITLMGYQQADKTKAYRSFAVLTLAAFGALNAVMFDTALAYSAALIIGALTTVGGYWIRDRVLVLAGVGLIAVAITPSVSAFIGTVDFTNWVTLAILGISTIILGSFVERKLRKEA